MAVGGFRRIPWGMDIENEELGRRLAEAGYNIVINPEIQVRHHFASLRKLLFIFTRRTYWWVRFFFQRGNRRFEQALTTRSFELSTLAGPLSLIFGLLPWLWPSDSYSPVFLLTSGLFLCLFLYGYGGFYRFLLGEKGIAFTMKGALVSYFFSFVIALGAFWGMLGAFCFWLKGEREDFSTSSIPWEGP